MASGISGRGDIALDRFGVETLSSRGAGQGLNHPGDTIMTARTLNNMLLAATIALGTVLAPAPAQS